MENLSFFPTDPPNGHRCGTCGYWFEKHNACLHKDGPHEHVDEDHGCGLWEENSR